MKKIAVFKLFLLPLFFISINTASMVIYPIKNKKTVAVKKDKKTELIASKKAFKKTIADVAPIITATGNEIYCPQTSVKIVSDVTITDSDNIDTEAIYIQISAGYVNGQDILTLDLVLHPTIATSWNAAEGKLKLSSPTPGLPVSYNDFVAAIKEVQFSNSSVSPSGSRNFSISIGQANYLPRNGHYYQYFSNLGISWPSAKTAAEATTYYGLQGYLATITAADEAQLAGKQAAGAGWIGGSDAENEGQWKWVTGPENGTVFWNGLANGSSPNFALWNTNEPNQSGDEDYAHITAPGVGIAGSWNDLRVNGDPDGSYQPKGYIVEYGGMPGDPILQISASTTLTILEITAKTSGSRCDPGTVTLQASASAGSINWYDGVTNGNLLGTGNNFQTPFLNNTTVFYAEASFGSCNTVRTAVEAVINNIPTLTFSTNPVTKCGSGIVELNATTTEGVVNWYANATSGTILKTGLTFTTPNLTTNTTYYAEAVNNNCSNGIRNPIDIIIYPLPIVNDETLVICQSQSLLLDAQVDNMTYLWSTGATSQTIIVVNTGIYTVDVTSPDNCTSRKTINVIENTIPEIKNVLVDGTTATIELVKKENYFEYSVDGVNYQSSNVFYNLSSVLQTAFVREINLCSSDSQNFVVLIIPKFFTPNSDSFNDSWEVKGLINYPLAEVFILDRYGKVIQQLNASKPTWDGLFNNKLLPESDYWYVIKIDNLTPVIKGHFSLKR